MKKHIFLIFFVLSIVSGVNGQDYSKAMDDLVIMSYNIRFDNPADGVSSWDNRKSKVASLLEYYHPHIFGLQEALLQQIKYLDNELTEYDWVGVGRDDGNEKGEFSPVFYDTNILHLKEWGTFWLSDQPDKPSTGWDAALPRICTWAVFTLKSNNQQIYFFNTHFDHMGVNARVESSKLIVTKIKELKPGSKVILTGDFNQSPESVGYTEIIREFSDARLVSMTRAYGPEGTFSGFKSGSDLGDRIDYIFISKDLISVNFRTIADHDGKYYPSDHLPVYAIIRIH